MNGLEKMLCASFFCELVKFATFMYSMMGEALVNRKIIGSFKIDIGETGA